MANKQSTDAVIIGAGVIGVAIAFELGKRGYRTINIDKLPAAGAGPTSNSCAIVRGHYSTWDGVAMARESFESWRNWDSYVGVSDDYGMARYVDTGVVLIKSSSGHHKKALTHYSALGIPFEEWTPDELVERFPIYSKGSFWPPTRPKEPGFWQPPEQTIEGAVFTPWGGYVIDPLLASHNLQRAAEALGGDFMYRTEVSAIRIDADRVVGVTLTDGREIDAQVVVNVAGPHSYVINRMAGVEEEMKVRTRALRHEVHQVPSPPGFNFETDGVMTSDGDQSIYFRPAGGNQILVGSEDPECDPREWVEDPDTYNRGITESQWEAQVYRLARRIPSLKIPTERTGAVDLYDVSDDWIPIYDKSSLPGFYMAIGTSGNQFKNAPIAGQMMAELIQAVEGGHDHDVDPVKVTAPYSKLELNVGFYSRLREINPNSSFSVAG